MRYNPIVTTKDSDLAEATRIMIRNRISGVPVIDLHNNLQGIITKTAIVRAQSTTRQMKGFGNF